MERGGETQPWTARPRKGKNTWGGKEKGNLLSSFHSLPPSPPPPSTPPQTQTSPVSSIVLDHNRGLFDHLKNCWLPVRMLSRSDLKTEPTIQNREGVPVNSLGPCRLKKKKKGPGFTGDPPKHPPTSFLYIPLQHIWTAAMLQRAVVMGGGGLEE